MTPSPTAPHAPTADTESESDLLDLCVIGGGVNGTGIARDAAGRGLSVVLCEKDDLAQGTSSRSGKLVHGGLRYLEYYEFRLVREALIEREVLMESAPHIIWPLRFVLPHSPQDRPAWLIRLGLFLYDHLGGRKRLPGTRTLDLRSAPEGLALRDSYHKAFEYSDCWVDDARLVVLNALDAADRGAKIYPRTTCTSARREDGHWRVELKSGTTGQTRVLRCKALVNAAGPWVQEVLGKVTGFNSSRNIRLVKGSHLVVPKFWDGPQAYLVQNTDKRVIFINPYEDDLCLIGTTDVPYEGTADEVAVDQAEVDYLLSAVNRYFKQQLSEADIVHRFSGVRPLYDDAAENPSAVTRDYVFDLDDQSGAPMLSVFGGKITTFRKLAEHALQKLQPYFPDLGPDWTAQGSLPGGDIPDADFDSFRQSVTKDYPWLPASLADHLSRLYGTRLRDLLGPARSLEDLGKHFGAQLYEAEAHYLMEREWAVTAEDILERRTKHGLHLSAQERRNFETWCAGKMAKAG
ncbi:glycerol-3-phosphate dehydrogenase [Denitrobaculum tricleocarpae]|uniref:Glycerol-3-phosphate dehydrogenase n=1 Tax=Denitrobaculum tricleocarpae TaxID=2591009 RepID=A0A545U0U6_9PROT|nr:glycerol-3-phosphate dehydrogenase [Denitrobaculum tricleocarpae]TQV83076.1 glycerol-3-phosphate dehydrogenase [Denitrobaculum tricleocarpae]